MRFLLSLLTFFVAFQAGAQEPLGMVLDVQGSVTASEGGKAGKVEMLSYLRPNMDLDLAAGAALTVTWYANSKELKFAGPAKLKVLKDRVQVVQGAGANERSLGEERVAATKSTRLAQATIMMRSVGAAKSEATSPARGARIAEATPRITWRGADDMSYRFVLTEALGGAPVVDMVVKGNAASVPANKLEFGKAYKWKAQYQPAGGATAAEGDFSLISRAEADRIQKLRPAAGASFSDWVLYATALEDASLRSEARPVWKKLAAERPDEPRLKQFADR
jgi:hypothetical protein